MPDNKLTKKDIEIISKVESAITDIVVSQKKLLERGRVERTFTSRLAQSIQTTLNIENITADPFYNKHIKETKYLKGKVIELDSAVHKEETDSHNLIAIEIETNNNPKYDDLWKVEGLTEKGGEYSYSLGLYVAFGVDKKAGEILDKIWYKNTVPIKF
jgi:hypothetical protein